MKDIVKYLWAVWLIAIVCFAGCGNKNSESNAEDNKIVTPSTIVNLRTGPGTSYGIVTGLHPGEKLIVSAEDYDGWVEVVTEHGKTGYVASKYLEELDAEAYKRDRVGEKLPASMAFESKSFDISKHRDGSFLSDYMQLMMSDTGFFIVLAMFAIQLCVCLYLKKRYNYTMQTAMYKRHPVGQGIFAILVSSVVTIFQIIAIFSVRDGASSNDMVYTLMILSTGIVMVTIPWRLRISGLDRIRQLPSNSYEPRVEWASKLGSWTWAVVLIPLSVFYIQGSHYADLTVDDGSFWGMVIALGVFLLFTWLFCKYFWTYVIIKYLFKSMNSGTLGIVNCILVLGIGIMGYDMCDSSFSGLIYIISLWALVMILMIDLGALLSTVNEKRCGNCHTFEGEHTSTTDMGSHYHTDREWKSGSDSMITRRHENSVISDNRRLVSTTKRVDKWKTHHVCPNCYSGWDIDHSSETTVSSQTLERRWTETYID